MKIIKPQSLSLIYRTLFVDRRYKFYISPILFFSLSEPGKVIPEQLGWQKIMAELGHDGILDIGAPKHKPEILMSGSAVPIQDSQQTSMNVGFSLSDKEGESVLLKKTIMAYGDQYWQLNSNTWCLSNIAPLSATPLTSNNSYGGQGYLDNPNGTGYLTEKDMRTATSIKLPNLRAKNGEYESFSSIRNAKPTFVNLGALSLNSPIRQSRAGTYDEQWLANDYPGLAADHDPAIYNITQEDQWLNSIAGNELLTIEGMHPKFSQIKSQLPSMMPRAFIQRAETTSDTLFEVDLNIDTLWLFPNQDIGVMISRGGCEVSDSEAQDLESIMVAYERMDDQARSLTYYQNVHKLRSNPEESAAHLLNDSQLTPLKTKAQLKLEDEEIRVEKQKRKALIEANSSQITQSVSDKLTKHKAQVSSDLIAQHQQLTTPNKTQLAELSETANKLVNLYDSNVSIDEDNVLALKDAAEKLDTLPLEQWKKALPKKTNLTALLSETHLFTEQSQKDKHDASIHAQTILTTSKALRSTFDQVPNLSEAKMKHQGVELDELKKESVDLLTPFNLKETHVSDVPILPLPETLENVPSTKKTTLPHGITLNNLIKTSSSSQNPPLNTNNLDSQTVIQRIKDKFDEMPIITPQAIKRGDIDLSGVIRAAKKLTDQCKKESESTLATLDDKISDVLPNTSTKERQAETEKKVSLADVKVDLQARFNAPKANKHLSIEQLKVIESSQRMARLVAPSDSTNAKNFTANVRDYLREKVAQLMQNQVSLAGLDLSGANLKGLDFSNQDMTGVMLESTNLEHCNFQSTILTGAVLTNAIISNACFDSADFSNANLSAIQGEKVSFKNCSFEQSKMTNAVITDCDFSKSYFNSVVIMESKLHLCVFDDCLFNQVQWVKCEMPSSHWNKSRFKSSIFMQSSLKNTLFIKSNINRCIFLNVDFSSSQLRFSELDCVQFAGTCDLTSVDFRGCTGVTVGLLGINLSSCILIDSVFKESNFTQCHFENVQLDRAGFLRCVFSEAKFVSVTAHECNFMESLMRKSYWLNSDLKGSDFFDANTKQCVFEYCELLDTTHIGNMVEVRA